jgi:hypothetical protein
MTVICFAPDSTSAMSYRVIDDHGYVPFVHSSFVYYDRICKASTVKLMKKVLLTVRITWVPLGFIGVRDDRYVIFSVVRRYQRAHQKIPKRLSEAVIRGGTDKTMDKEYQRDHQKLWFEKGQTKQWTEEKVQ